MATEYALDGSIDDGVHASRQTKKPGEVVPGFLAS